MNLTQKQQNLHDAPTLAIVAVKTEEHEFGVLKEINWNKRLLFRNGKKKTAVSIWIAEHFFILPFLLKLNGSIFTQFGLDVSKDWVKIIKTVPKNIYKSKIHNFYTI